MDRQEAVQALDLLRRVVRQARDESALNNWGVIWMIHAVTNGAAFALTDVLVWRGNGPREIFAMWGAVVVANIAIALGLRRRSGARSFVETQMWTIWLAFIAAMPLIAALNMLAGLPVMTYAPVVALLAAYAFAMMGMLMSPAFYGAAGLFVATSLAMALHHDIQFVIMGAVWAPTQFTWGLVLQCSRRPAAELV